MPIDISFQKLVEWLIDRKQCSQDWKKLAEPLRKKRRELLEKVDLGSNEELENMKLQCLEGTPTQFDLEIIFDHLKADKKNREKNFMGRYTSQISSDFDNILSEGKKGNLYLIDTASAISKIVQYDLPEVRSQIVRLTKLTSDTNRKIAEHERNAAKYLSSFKESCASWGIEGKNVREELSKVPERDLPVFYDQIVQQATDNREIINEAIEYYTAFIKYVTQATEGNEGEVSEEEGKSELQLSRERESRPCNLLSFWVAHGNCAVTDWDLFLQTGETPIHKQDQVGIEIMNEIVLSEESGIDFSGIQIEEQEEKKIDLDLSSDIPVSLEEGADGENISVDFGGEINWDIGEIESSGGTPTIDWGEGVGEIEIVDDMEIGVDSFVVEESGSVSTTTILDNGETKRKLMSDLMELEIFLMQRLSEMKGKANLLSINQFQYASSLIQRQTISTVETFLECIQNILKQFNSDRIKLLFEMKSSRLFVERTSLTIRQKEDAASKLQMIVLELTSKRETYAASISNHRPILDQIISRVKKLQKRLEKALSEVINRPVHIIGEINNI